MKVVKVKNELIEKLIHIIVDDEILSMKPVISGGLVSCLYHGVYKPGNDAIMYELGRILRADNYNELIAGRQDPDYLVGASPDEPCVDRNSILLNFKSNYVIKEVDCFYFSADIDIYQASSSKIPSEFTRKYDRDDNNREYKDVSSFPIKRGNYKLLFSSDNANTFSQHRGKPVGKKIQFIRKIYNTPEDIISEFDISVCKIAYHDGWLYIHEDFQESFENKTISLSKGREDFYLAQKIKTACRVYKYIKRTGYSVSDDAMIEIHDSFIDMLRSVTKINADNNLSLFKDEERRDVGIINLNENTVLPFIYSMSEFDPDTYGNDQLTSYYGLTLQIRDILDIYRINMKSELNSKLILSLIAFTEFYQIGSFVSEFFNKIELGQPNSEKGV